jgi:hypothetical protein
MSRRLGALVLAMGILVGAMGLKTVFTAHAKGTLVANGPAIPPTPRPSHGQ